MKRNAAAASAPNSGNGVDEPQPLQRGNSKARGAAPRNKQAGWRAPLLRAFQVAVAAVALLLVGTTVVLHERVHDVATTETHGERGDIGHGPGRVMRGLGLSWGARAPRRGVSHSGSTGTARPWMVVSIEDFGAAGDNKTDNTAAFRAAFDAIRRSGGGGEVIVPSGGVYQTAPFNLTSNVVFTVKGTVFGVEGQHNFPKVPALPSYGRCADMRGKYRRHPLVHAMDATNITIRGSGTIDGNGWYWYPFFFNFTEAYNIGRPHLMEIRNCTNVEITEVTLKDSAFWTLHPVYCKNVHIHHARILAPSCRNYKCANTDGIDIDSCENVLVEHNYIDVGDDHVTILAGKLRPLNGVPRSPRTRNITVQHNTLKSGMGLSIGSSTAGGISDVLYYNNVMTEESRKQMGQGIHIKLRDRYSGYIRNVSWVDNVFYVAGKPGGAIVFESGYQSGWRKKCDNVTCTEVRDILVRNLTVHEGNPGRIECYKARPCVNITFDNVKYMDPNAQIKCKNVGSGRVVNPSPPDLFDRESCASLYGESLADGPLKSSS